MSAARFGLAATLGAVGGLSIPLLLPVSPLYTVERITDGDTIRVQALTNGQRLLWAESGPEAVRFQCIGTPELNEPGGREAAAFLAHHLERGQLVELEPDTSPGARRRDNFGRMLAVDVRTVGGEDLALALIHDGLARVMRGYPCPASRLELLTTAEREAREAKRGVWQ
jgi:endonuclease YncB( thermonuclease family)